jgi:hypothetical protein
VTTDTLSPSDDVFINCPFDADYAAIFEALIFTVIACGFRPRTARELDDASQTRIDKIYGLVEQCRYGVHDLSRTELDAVHNLPRFNMPLELGIFLGAKRFGDAAQKQKRCLVLDVEPYRYQRFISDLAGVDPQAHDGDPRRAAAQLRNWLANVSRRDLPGERAIVDLLDRWTGDRLTLAERLGFDPAAVPYIDLTKMIAAWLLTIRPVKL